MGSVQFRKTLENTLLNLASHAGNKKEENKVLGERETFNERCACRAHEQNGNCLAPVTQGAVGCSGKNRPVLVWVVALGVLSFRLFLGIEEWGSKTPIPSTNEIARAGVSSAQWHGSYRGNLNELGSESKNRVLPRVLMPGQMQSSFHDSGVHFPMGNKLEGSARQSWRISSMRLLVMLSYCSCLQID